MTPVPDAKLSLEILIMSAESTFRLPTVNVPDTAASPVTPTPLPVAWKIFPTPFLCIA